MAKVRYIVRGALLTFIVLIPVYLFVKSEKTMKRSFTFKHEMIESFQGNSMKQIDSKIKFDLLAHESERFSNQVIGDVYNIREGVQYLLIFIVMFLVIEVIWIFIRKPSRN
jgi:hypothetical protein